jgi:hypothetical protein
MLNLAIRSIVRCCDTNGRASLPQQRLADYRRQPASAIVSLGRSCATAYNLRRHFDFGGAFPFDWWITPLAAVEAVLRRPDPDWLYDPALLELTEKETSVRHRETDILLHHEFPRHWLEPAQPVRPDFRETISGPKKRTAALLAKLLQLNSPTERLLFVRERIPGETGSLANILEEVFNRAKWALIELDQIRGPDWQGDLDQWDEFLSGLGVSFSRPAGEKPFSEVQPGGMPDER